MKTKTLERAMRYLACPGESASLKISEANERDGKVWGGYLQCEKCNRKYPIKDGVLFFYDGRETPALRSVGEAKNAAVSSMEEYDAEGCIGVLSSFATSLLRGQSPEERLDCIRRVGDLVKEVESFMAPDERQRLILLQAFNAARYDLEEYKGTFVLPVQPRSAVNSFFCDRDAQGRSGIGAGIVFEGGCATGENIAGLRLFMGQAKPFLSEEPIYVGLDLSGKLISEAQRRFEGENILFVQGNVLNPPIADGSVSLYMAFNIWDRVPSPRAAAEKARWLLIPDGRVIVGNCTPLQYETPDGRIIYVPGSERASLTEIARIAGCDVAGVVGGVEWSVETILYSKEKFAMEIVFGRKKGE